MNALLNIALALVLIILSYQDFKDREVSFYLLLLGVFLGGYLHLNHQNTWVFLSNISFNLVFIGIIFFILFLYAKFKMNAKIFDVFGQGDLLFFVFLAVSLPIVAFLIVFVFSLFFSLLVYGLIKHRFTKKTVPLAGLQSVFFLLCMLLNQFTNTVQLYQL